MTRLYASWRANALDPAPYCHQRPMEIDADQTLTRRAEYEQQQKS